MKKLILLGLMLIVSLTYGQYKQSLYELYPSLVHKDVMNTEYDTGFMGGVPTVITYTQGKANFNGSTSNITYRSVNGVKAVRLKLTLSTTTQAVLTLSATHSISVTSGTISATGFASPTIYVNGAISSTITTAESEIVVTTATAINANTIILGKVSTSYLTGSVNEFDLYTRAISASEIYNMYLGVHHKDLPSNQAEVLGGEKITNGSITGNTGWLFTGTGAYGTNNIVLTSNSTNNANFCYQVATGALSKIYKLSYEVISNSTVGGATLVTASAALSGSILMSPLVTLDTTVGVHTAIVNSYSSGSTNIFGLGLNGGSSGNITIDNISLKEVLSASTPLLIDFNSTAGQIKSSVGNVWTASNATTKRAGSIFASSFNGTTSYLSTPNVNLSGNITVIGWFKMDNFGQNNLGNILNDTKLVVRVNSTNSVLQLTRDNSTYASSATSALQAGKVYLFACTSTNTGVTNFYLADAKGSVVASGTANQSAGTPSNGSIILIGNNSTSSPTRTFKGIIPRVQVFGSILTVNQITQSWSNLTWMMQ